MKINIKILLVTVFLFSGLYAGQKKFLTLSAKESAALSCSPSNEKRTLSIERNFSIDGEELLKKRSHKRRRKVRRPREGR